MCGIFGTSNVNNELENNSKINLLHHRGPDQLRKYTDESVFLGHTLFSLSGAYLQSPQPVCSNESPWILLFNGQIYSYQELVADFRLPLTGDYSDTDVLYALIQRTGERFIEHIDGMYAICLYNKHEKKIRLYRDPSGQKNLYYREYNGFFSFSSEIHPLIRGNENSDKSAIIQAAIVGFNFNELTIIDGIRKIIPGECIEYNLKSNITTKYKYKKSSRKTSLNIAIEQHATGNSRIAANLSGGIDSSILYSHMLRAGTDITAYSTYFVDANHKYNEDYFCAKKLSQHFGGKFEPVEITKRDFIDNFQEAYSRVEEPNYNRSLPIYLAHFKYMGANNLGEKIVLSGDGGDEVFLGYKKYHDISGLSGKIKILTSMINWVKRYGSIPPGINGWVLWWLRDRGVFSITDVYKIRETLTQIQKYLNDMSRDSYNYKDAPFLIQKCDRHLWLANENFIRNDKLAMSQTLEMRSPFAYSPVRNFYDSRYGDVAKANRSGPKNYLREMYRDKLPSFILNKPKTGWTAPIGDWFNGELRELVVDIISKGHFEVLQKPAERTLLKLKKNENINMNTVILLSSFAVLSHKYDIGV